MFEEVRLPTDVLYSSTGGPQYLTYVQVSEGGQEQRSSVWQIARHSYVINYVKQESDRDSLFDFFHAMRGRLIGFRFKDWNDYKSVGSTDTIGFEDVAIGSGDGIETEFQLIKAYPKGNQLYNRDIVKPVLGTVRVGVDGVELTETVDWTVDTVTGLITFAVAPLDTLIITAGFEFDVPVRFDTDHMNLANLACDTGGMNFPIVELKDP